MKKLKIKWSQPAPQVMYLIQMGETNYYKIGITDNINRRWSQLQTGNPLELKVVCLWIHKQRQIIKRYERVLHRYFTKLGQRTETQKEWFMLTDEQVQMIVQNTGIQKQNKIIEKILEKM